MPSWPEKKKKKKGRDNWKVSIFRSQVEIEVQRVIDRNRFFIHHASKELSWNCVVSSQQTHVECTVHPYMYVVFAVYSKNEKKTCDNYEICYYN